MFSETNSSVSILQVPDILNPKQAGPFRSWYSQGGGADTSPCVISLLKTNDHEIWSCHTTSKALPGNNKTFDDIITRTFL